MSVRIRKTGNTMWPWEVRCTKCSTYCIHTSDVGAVAVNSRGVGNRSWSKALQGGIAHLRWHEENDERKSS